MFGFKKTKNGIDAKRIKFVFVNFWEFHKVCARIVTKQNQISQINNFRSDRFIFKITLL